ncbi:MAG: transglycosylase domain-containing protein [Erysipelotrichaceae bacterium]|nr:transglycosylase domain-containing protein [Erysipelotrichaceae bacterium]
MKLIKKCFQLIMKTAFLLVLANVIYFGLSGWIMYRQCIVETPVEMVVQEIQSREDYISLNQISSDYIDALLESEDNVFYQHHGFNPISTLRALMTNIAEGYFAEGGSTITQQLAKNLYFDFEKKIERKVAELFMAWEIENALEKDEILEVYLNVIYYGENCYGIEDAAQHYYGVSAMDLNDEQIEALVVTVKSPNNYNPNVLTDSASLARVIEYINR